MKITLLIVALCATLALTHGRPEPRGIMDGISEILEKVKEFFDYLKSDEFQAKLKAICDRLKAAPNKAVECFKSAAQGNQEDIDAIAQKIKERLEEDFPTGDDSENGFEKLKRILSGIVKVLQDQQLREDIMGIAGEYKEAAQQGLDCFKAELEGIKADAQQIVDDIKAKFFSVM